MAALLALDFGLVCNEFAEVEHRLYDKQTMSNSGCTARMVIEYAKGRGLGAAILHNGRALEQAVGPTPLVAALLGSHLYFYKSGRIRKKLLGWNTKPATTQKLRREHKSSTTTPPAEEWKAWSWELTPGHYYASEEEMTSIRAWFLSGARSPRVVLKDAGVVRTLLYTCTAKDGCKGSICVHAAPPEFQEIMQWLTENASV